MARKTKAQLNAERQIALQEQALEQAIQAEREYPALLMSTLQATFKSSDYLVSVSESKFVVAAKDVLDKQYVFELNYSRESADQLDDLLYELNTADARRRAAAHAARAYANAQNKLTVEYRKILDL